MFSNIWSENTALFERLMEIHSNSPKLYYGFNNVSIRECSSIFQLLKRSLYSYLFYLKKKHRDRREAFSLCIYNLGLEIFQINYVSGNIFQALICKFFYILFYFFT